VLSLRLQKRKNNIKRKREQIEGIRTGMQKTQTESFRDQIAQKLKDELELYFFTNWFENLIL
jgi:hypothetical protein